MFPSVCCRPTSTHTQGAGPIFQTPQETSDCVVQDIPATMRPDSLTSHPHDGNIPSNRSHRDGRIPSNSQKEHHHKIDQDLHTSVLPGEVLTETIQNLNNRARQDKTAVTPFECCDNVGTVKWFIEEDDMMTSSDERVSGSGGGDRLTRDDSCLGKSHGRSGRASREYEDIYGHIQPVLSHSASFANVSMLLKRHKLERAALRLNEARRCVRIQRRRNALDDPLTMPMPQQTRERIQGEVAIRKASVSRKVSQVFKILLSDEAEIDLV